MANHIRNLSSCPSTILETSPVSLQSAPRERLAALAALGLARCPAEIVAQRCGRSPATVHGWRHAPTVGGLRALDLVLAPRPFGLTVVRGLVSSMGGPPSDGPSRSLLAAVLARVAGVLILADREDLSRLPDEALRERLATIEDSAAALEAQRQRHEGEILKRRIEAARRAAKGEG